MKTIFPALLLIAGTCVPLSSAQDAEMNELKWTFRAFSTHGMGSAGLAGGIVDFFTESGFDDDEYSCFFFCTTREYPSVKETESTWSFLAAYEMLPHLSVGGHFYRPPDVQIVGRRSQPSEPIINISFELRSWAIAPILIWEPETVATNWRVPLLIDLGGGPALIRGAISFQSGENTREHSFQRPGAVVFISSGFALIKRHLYLGVQVHYLYAAGSVDSEPFRSPNGRYTLARENIEVSQWTFGPVLALNY